VSAARLAVFLAVACSPARVPLPSEATPGVTFPMHVMEGKGEGKPVSSAKPAQSAPPPPPSSPPRPPRPSPPDPEPLRTAKQYEINAVWEDYRVRVESARELTFKQPIVTERRIGRFAVELWVGNELIDRVRFDFPLLADDPTPTRRRPLHEPSTFAGSVLRAKVMVPASPRVRRAVIFDRATGNETELAWPPAPTPSSAAPAGSAAAPPASTAAPAPAPAPTPSSAAPAVEPHGAARLR